MNDNKEVNNQATRKTAYTLAATAAGAAAAVTCGEAQGQIAYSGVQDIAIAQFNSQAINLDGDAYNDILLKNYVFGGGNYQGTYVYYYPGKTIGFTGAFAYSTALSAGDPINATEIANGGFATTSLAYGANNPQAQFNSVADAYIGLQFDIAATAHYGWLRVTIDNAAGVFIVHDWAYNSTPGEGIAAGQTMLSMGVPGDFDGDGFVGLSDLNILGANFGINDGSATEMTGDANSDGNVDLADLNILGANWNPPPATAVPEPISLGLLAAGAAGVVALRDARQRR